MQALILHAWLLSHSINVVSCDQYLKHSGVKVKVALSCLSLCIPMACSPPGSSVHGILQARILDWVAIPFSRGSSQPKDQTWVSCIAGRFFTVWAAREAPCDLTNVYRAVHRHWMAADLVTEGGAPWTFKRKYHFVWWVIKSIFVQAADRQVNS